jgi:hypothetical protein
MAKQGQHNNDARDSDKSKGHNNPKKSVTITAGTPKKQETYAEQARNHEDPGKQAQAKKNEWNEDTRDPVRAARQADGTATRAREGDLTGNRSGSDSDASRRTRGG